jgi:hypothetical protein
LELISPFTIFTVLPLFDLELYFEDDNTVLFVVEVKSDDLDERK